ncbi:hypothetical protein BASA61_005117 [Batrachochytrium salamandrivorans]|nr:hypothetical protein BASA61_005117 [Batrachochytrium salamandrivorans]
MKLGKNMLGSRPNASKTPEKQTSARQQQDIPLEIISTIGILSGNPHLSKVNRVFSHVTSSTQFRAKWLLYHHGRSNALAMVWNYGFMNSKGTKCGCTCAAVALKSVQQGLQDTAKGTHSLSLSRWRAVCELVHSVCRGEVFVQKSFPRLMDGSFPSSLPPCSLDNAPASRSESHAPLDVCAFIKEPVQSMTSSSTLQIHDGGISHTAHIDIDSAPKPHSLPLHLHGVKRVQPSTPSDLNVASSSMHAYTGSKCPLEQYQIELITSLVYYGGDISAFCHMSLCMAATYGHLHLVELVMSFGADPETRIGRHHLPVDGLSTRRSVQALYKCPGKIKELYLGVMWPHHDFRQKQIRRYRSQMYFLDRMQHSEGGQEMGDTTHDGQDRATLVAEESTAPNPFTVVVVVVGSAEGLTSHQNTIDSHPTLANPTPTNLAVLPPIVTTTEPVQDIATTVPDELNLNDPNTLFDLGIAHLFPENDWEYDACILRSLFYQAVLLHHVQLTRLLLGLPLCHGGSLPSHHARSISSSTLAVVNPRHIQVSSKTRTAALSCAFVQNHLDIADVLIHDTATASTVEMMQDLISRAGLWRVVFGDRTRFSEHLKLCISGLSDLDFQRISAHLLKSCAEIGSPSVIAAILSRGAKTASRSASLPIPPPLPLPSLPEGSGDTVADLVNVWEGTPLYAAVSSGNIKVTAFLLSVPEIRLEAFTRTRFMYCFGVLAIEAGVLALFATLVGVMLFWIAAAVQGGYSIMATDVQGVSLAQMAGMTLLSWLAVTVMYHLAPFHHILWGLRMVYLAQRGLSHI